MRLFNTDKWSLLKQGEVIALRGDGRREVKLELNAPAPTSLYLVQGDKRFFLCVFQGREDVQFSCEGPDCEVWPTSDDELWFVPSEGDEYSDGADAVSFATVMNRQVRNPELEHMMFKLEQNMNRRMEMQAAELAAWRDAHKADPLTGEVDEPPVSDAPVTGDKGGAEVAAVDPAAADKAKGPVDGSTAGG